ncbi:S8 family serine peptidase [Bacillaceae bacterium Marseille-Q3522]|nr:S8 family serine peptidase [Bacillaceae bacterium Marseille-Q3522]
MNIQAATLKHPPIPAESNKQEKVAIVLLEKAKSREEIERLLAGFDHVEIRNVFQHAITGFSIKTNNETLEQMAKKQNITAISPVYTYQIKQEDNIELIGSEIVRGVFDDNHQRLTGKGITIGIIDTGVDYSHPDLSRNFKGGRDFVDMDNDPMETISRGEGSTLHGTHVAGVIAANGKMRGVAPEAAIIAYRSLGPGGFGSTEQIIAAIEAAIIDRVDILNLSLGNSVNGPDLPISLALNRAVEHGIVAVTSTGNSGPKQWTVGSPGTAEKAISVGATSPTLKIPYLQIDNEMIRLELFQGSASWDMNRTYDLTDGKKGRKEDLQDAGGKIVLIERGELTFSEKAANAREAGAAAVLIYNNTSSSYIGIVTQKQPFPVAAVSKKIGEKLKAKLEKQKVTAKVAIMEEKDFLADFSSRGPVTSTWEMKPDVLAPGVAIESTIPGGYLSLQGTSMAAPHVAGAAALVKQAHPDWTPTEIKAALMNTALPLHNRSGKRYKAYEQGSGRIRVDEAVKTNWLVMPGSLPFRKFTKEDTMQQATLTVENKGKVKDTVRFAIPKKEQGVHWKIPPSFPLAPGEKKEVTVQLTLDPQLIKGKIADGRLTVHAGNQKIELPYLYMAGEPNYPRLMGFAFAKGEAADRYRYEIYLPGGADEFGIALFDPVSLAFVQFLDWERDVASGMLEKEILLSQRPPAGTYLAKIFAKKAGKEDVLESIVEIE